MGSYPYTRLRGSECLAIDPWSKKLERVNISLFYSHLGNGHYREGMEPATISYGKTAGPKLLRPNSGGQSGAAVTRPHGYHQDVGSNPAVARNEKTHIWQTPAQKVPQLCGRI